MASVFRLPHTQFHAGFVCNFLSSSAGLNLCSCFFRLTLFRLSASFGLMLPRPDAASPSLSSSAVFRPLSRPSVLGSDYSAFVSSFPVPPGSASQWLPQRRAPPFGFPLIRFHPAWFPVRSVRFSVLGLLFVSFHPSLPRSHSRSSGAHLPLSRSVFFPSRSFLSSVSVRFRLLRFPFLTFPFTPASPNGGSSGANLSAFRLPVSMRPSGFGTQHAASSVLRLSGSPHSGYSSARPSSFRILGRSP